MSWKTTILRWLAWIGLCAGMLFELFVIRDTGIAVINRSLAREAIRRQQAGRLLDVTELGNFANFDTIVMLFFLGVIIVGLVVFLDYYLRAGERMGRLLKRIGLAAGIELGVFALAMIIQYAVEVFG